MIWSKRYQGFSLRGRVFFAVDLPDPSDVKSAVKDQPPTLNRVVGLRDTWAKIDQKQRKNNNNNNEKGGEKSAGRNRGGGGRGGAAPKEAVPDYHQLQFLVGKIVDVSPHPDAEKLWVEQIDLGEPTGPRTIVSGLKSYYTAEELNGRRVVVAANLKYSKLRGIQSQGMVLCASNAEHSKVELLEPPETAQLGDRVGYEGADLAAHPLGEAKINPKAKTSPWPRVQAKLTVDANGVPMYDSKGLVVEGHGPCSVASLKDATIS